MSENVIENTKHSESLHYGVKDTLLLKKKKVNINSEDEELDVKKDEIRTALFSNFIFSVLVLAIGNISKPFPLWFSVERVIKAFTKWLNVRKGKKCMMTQI